VQPDDLTAAWDQDLIRQVVANLVDNALRYACRAGQERTAGVISVTAAGLTDRVVLSVRDDGPGFPVDFLPHAFERFSRPDTARGRTDGGAGLGLSIVELISGAHGGQARVANRPEGGAEITVELPEPQ
jgi:two-component system OmpR family sensor kinase